MPDNQPNVVIRGLNALGDKNISFDRREYGITVLSLIAVTFVLGIGFGSIEVILNISDNQLIGPLSSVWGIIAFVVLLIATAKRLDNLSWPKWNLVFLFVPFLGFIFMIILLCKPGEVVNVKG